METPIGWEKTKKGLVREFVFAGFSDALHFINKVADKATSINHHPEIWNSYNKVHLVLFTHDEDAITQKDIALALEINTL